jgi:hypothetical protein
MENRASGFNLIIITRLQGVRANKHYKISVNRSRGDPETEMKMFVFRKDFPIYVRVFIHLMISYLEVSV